MPIPGDDTAVYLNNFSGKYSQPGAAKNSFSIYRVNAVSMTAPEAQFKRLLRFKARRDLKTRGI
ncbi:TPA: hypothetical protein M2I24_003604 [Escherichia coli]|nr:hypothetical protein [Escherichia coli]